VHIPKEVARVTRTVPIVMAGSYNPVEAGLVASLARPGGNITGLTANSGPEIEAKRLQLLKEVTPAVSRIAFLGLKSDWESPEGKSVGAVTPRLGITLVHAEHTHPPSMAAPLRSSAASGLKPCSYQATVRTSPTAS